MLEVARLGEKALSACAPTAAAQRPSRTSHGRMTAALLVVGAAALSPAGAWPSAMRETAAVASAAASIHFTLSSAVWGCEVLLMALSRLYSRSSSCRASGLLGSPAADMMDWASTLNLDT